MKKETFKHTKYWFCTLKFKFYVNFLSKKAKKNYGKQRKRTKTCFLTLFLLNVFVLSITFHSLFSLTYAGKHTHHKQFSFFISFTLFFFYLEKKVWKNDRHHSAVREQKWPKVFFVIFFCFGIFTFHFSRYTKQ